MAARSRKQRALANLLSDLPSYEHRCLLISGTAACEAKLNELFEKGWAMSPEGTINFGAPYGLNSVSSIASGTQIMVFLQREKK